MSALKLASLPKRLTIGYIVALSIVAGLASLAWLAQHTLLERQADNAVLINISGRQRMLSQRIGLLAQQMLSASDDETRWLARQELRTSLTQFSAAHKAILEGDELIGLSGDITLEARDYYERSLNPKFARYVDLVERLLASSKVPGAEEQAILQEVLTLGLNDLLDSLHRGVLLHQRSAEDDVSTLANLELGILIATLMALLIEARVVFRPLINQLVDALNTIVEQEALTAALNDVQRGKTQLAEAIDAVPVGFVAWDDDMKLVACNQLYRNMHPHLAPHLHIGSPLQEVLKRAYLSDKPEEAMDDLDERIDRQMQDFLTESCGEERLNGRGEWCLVHRRTTDSGRRVSTWTDITQRKIYEAQMTQLALTDTLTGLANREQFDRELPKAIVGGRRTGERFAVMMMDLNRFKVVNDTWGHPVGDELLKQVSERLRAALRGLDIIARFGGDEFAVLIRGASEPDSAIRVANRLINELCTPFLIGGRTLSIGTSIGIAYYPDNANQADELIRMADVALYQAKETGGNVWRNWEYAMDQNSMEQNRLSHEVVGAIRSGQLEPHYQPVLNDQGEVVHFEALLRWNHPELGLLTPDRFLPALQSRPEICQIGRYVIREACSAMARWRRRNITPRCIAVNISSHEFADPGLVDYVIEELGLHELPTSALKLELTEATVMDLSPEMIDKMKHLEALGVEVALDDFGTGYSSLKWLQRLPIRSLKIDRSFVSGLPSDPGSMAIVEAMLVLSRKMGLTVVAEGVENTEQQAYLRDSGCQGFQGWLYSKALPEAELIAWLLQDKADPIEPKDWSETHVA